MSHGPGEVGATVIALTRAPHSLAGPHGLEDRFNSCGVSAQDIERAADMMTQDAAFLSAYAGARGANGFGDHGHAAAVEAGRKTLKKVRKALGYLQP